MRLSSIHVRFLGLFFTGAVAFCAAILLIRLVYLYNAHTHPSVKDERLIRSMSFDHEYTYIGCYKKADLQIRHGVVESLESCLQLCKDYTYTGMMIGDHCECGNELSLDKKINHVDTPDECTFSCPGLFDKSCGGYFASSIYVHGVVPSNAHTHHHEEKHQFLRSFYTNVDVVLVSDESRMVGLITAMNSIIQNTAALVNFYIITDNTSKLKLDIWTKHTFPKINIQIRVFDEQRVAGKIKIRGHRRSLANPLNYARYYIPEIFPEIEGVFVFLDDDVVVTGDIVDLRNTNLSDHMIAFSNDCSWLSKQYNLWENTYDLFINFKNSLIIRENMNPKECSFNAGVFVADISIWRKSQVTKQLEYWLELNTKEEIYGSGPAGGGSQPPMMIVFYKKYAELDPLWHLRSLGSDTKQPNDKELIVTRAKLLHWTGQNKPWLKDSKSSSVAYPIFKKYEIELPPWLQK